MGLDLKELELSQDLIRWYAFGLHYLLQDSTKQGLSRSEHSKGFASATEPDFPEPWRQIVKQQQHPCATIWTYWQLPIDCGPKSSEERKTLFRNIIHALGWNPEDYVLWPMSRETQGSLEAKTDCFWRGLPFFRPQYVLCFGRQTFGALFPQKTGTGFGLFNLDQITYIYLPGPEDMLPDQKQAKNLVWNLLKNLTFHSC